MSEEDRRLIEADILRRFSEFDIHDLIPHSEIANTWYHYGLDQAQAGARRWAMERDGVEDDDE